MISFPLYWAVYHLIMRPCVWLLSSTISLYTQTPFLSALVALLVISWFWLAWQNDSLYVMTRLWSVGQPAGCLASCCNNVIFSGSMKCQSWYGSCLTSCTCLCQFQWPWLHFMVTAAFAVLLLLPFVCRNGSDWKNRRKKGGKDVKKDYFSFNVLTNTFYWTSHVHNTLLWTKHVFMFNKSGNKSFECKSSDHRILSCYHFCEHLRKVNK